ncbi:MAG: hypothetical protein Q7J34_00080 [Bacteroidales bacterium]|nr:hypothetical protein [Bacteroidales bacterium]
MKQKLFIFISCFISILPAFSQRSSLNTLIKPIEDSASRGINNLERYLVSLPNGYLVEGTIYLDDAFKPGVLIRNDNSVQTTLLYRYNILRSEFHVLDGQDTGVLNSPESIKYLKLGIQTFIFAPYLENDKQSDGYFQVLTEGKYRLLIKHTLTFDRANPTCALLQFANEYDRLVPLKVYYVQQGVKPAEKIKNSLRNISKVINVSKDSLKEISLKNSLNIRKEEDLIRLFNHLNRN